MLKSTLLILSTECLRNMALISSSFSLRCAISDELFEPEFALETPDTPDMTDIPRVCLPNLPDFDFFLPSTKKSLAMLSLSASELKDSSSYLTLAPSPRKVNYFWALKPGVLIDFKAPNWPLTMLSLLLPSPSKSSSKLVKACI